VYTYRATPENHRQFNSTRKVRQMRISTRTSMIVIAAVTTAALLSACGGDNSAATETPSTAVSTVVEAPPLPVAAPKELTETQKQAFNYYMSDARRAPLNQALNSVGNDLLTKLTSGEIPSSTRGWDKLSDAPVNGYGGIVSEPSRGGIDPGTFVQVNVRFIDGQIDRQTGPLGVFILKDEYMISLNGLTPLTKEDGTPVAETSNSFSWKLDSRSRTTGSEFEKRGFYISDVESGVPGYENPLGEGSYQISDYSSDTGDVTVDDIKTADADFLATLYQLNIDGSDWN